MIPKSGTTPVIKERKRGRKKGGMKRNAEKSRLCPKPF